MTARLKAHFDPYSEDMIDRAPCGTEIKEEYIPASGWNEVTCKRCLKQKAKLEKWFRDTEKGIINDMGRMADFFKDKP